MNLSQCFYNRKDALKLEINVFNIKTFSYIFLSYFLKNCDTKILKSIKANALTAISFSAGHF